MFKYLAASLVLFCGISAAQATLIIDVGDHQLQPNLANQKVVVTVTGDVFVDSVQIEAQVADGGPGPLGGHITGPTIQEINLVDTTVPTIFAFNNNGQNPSDTGYIYDQLASRGTATSSGTVLANGALVVMTFDTTRCSIVPGTTWDLLFKGTLNNPGGGTVFGDTVPTVINGHVSIIPEPATALIAAAGAALLLSRRRRSV